MEERLRLGTMKSDDCWLWTGAKTVSGYGWLSGYGERKAHRVAWVVANGCAVPGRLHVIHSCDNRACVRPEHLRVGTNQENNDDKVARARAKHINIGDRNGMNTHPEKRAVGSRNGFSKLTEQDVLEIRRRANAGEGAAALATAFHVSTPTINRIKQRRIWRHI